MTNFNYPLEGKKSEEIAFYFSMTVESVEKAIEEGAKTYSDVYKFKTKNTEK